MKTKILLFSTFALCSVAAMAQSSNKAYAITGDGNNDFLWMNIRQIDLKTGTVQKRYLTENLQHIHLQM